MYIIGILIIVFIFFVLAAILHTSEPSESDKIIQTYYSHPILHYFITIEEFLEWLQFFNNVHDKDYWLIADLIVEHVLEENRKKREEKEKEYKKIIERII